MRKMNTGTFYRRCSDPYHPLFAIKLYPDMYSSPFTGNPVIYFDTRLNCFVGDQVLTPEESADTIESMLKAAGYSFHERREHTAKDQKTGKPFNYYIIELKADNFRR